MEGEMARLTAELLKVMQPSELEEIKLNRNIRRQLLQKYQEFYTLHIPELTNENLLRILQEVLD